MFQILTTVLAIGLVGPPLVVGLSAAGVPLATANVLGIAAAAGAFWRAARGAALVELRRSLGAAVLAGFLLALAVATFYNVRLSRFMLDATRAELSVLPERRFFREHSCLTSYTEAARFAPAGLNIYEFERYVDVPKPGEYKERYIGPLSVDVYQYPPAFLVLPGAVTGIDFFAVRKAWFFLQTVTLFSAMALVARWIGGRPGTIALLLVPLIWIVPTTRLTLQVGNFQLTGFPLVVLAMIAFEGRRHAIGGLALGFAAVSKIFPGVLGVVLLVTRRWRALAWTVGWGLAVTALAWSMVGSKPFVDFVTYQLQRIDSGEAFFWIEEPRMAPVNQSIYGLVTKLRLLGVPLTGQLAATRASSLYAVLVVAAAALAGWRLHRLRSSGAPADVLRVRHAQAWLGLLSLASFRSPFVPDGYGMIGTLWLLTLIGAEKPRRAQVWIGLAIAAVAFSVILDGGLVPSSVPTWMVLMTLAIQLLAIAFNVGVIFRRPPAAAPTGGGPLL